LNLNIKPARHELARQELEVDGDYGQVLDEPTDERGNIWLIEEFFPIHYCS